MSQLTIDSLGKFVLPKWFREDDSQSPMALHEFRECEKARQARVRVHGFQMNSPKMQEEMIAEGRL